MKTTCNDRQTRFVQEYAIDFNASRAALAAGYAPVSAPMQGCRLLKNAKVKAALAEYLIEQAQNAGLSTDWVLQKLKENVIGGLVDRDRQPVNKALELIGRYLQMFPTQLPPGSSPATPLFVAEVGYDVNELGKDPELRGLILEVDKRMRALAGVGIVEGEVTSVD